MSPSHGKPESRVIPETGAAIHWFLDSSQVSKQVLDRFLSFDALVNVSLISKALLDDNPPRNLGKAFHVVNDSRDFRSENSIASVISNRSVWVFFLPWPCKYY